MRTGKQQPAPAEVQKLINFSTSTEVKTELWQMCRDSFASDNIDCMNPNERVNRLYLYEQLCGVIDHLYKVYRPNWPVPSKDHQRLP